MEDCWLAADLDIKYSVLVAVYNSERSLRELTANLIDTLYPFSYEIILVDDASTDHSFTEILRLCTENPSLHYYRHDTNKGQSAALLTGLRHSKGEYIVTIDDDLQYDPADIKRLIAEEASTSADIVYGITNSRKGSWPRKVSSALVKRILSPIFKVPAKGSSFRLIRRTVFSLIPIAELQNSILPEALFARLDLKIAYAEVSHRERKYGRSGYSFFKLAELTLNSIRVYLRYLGKNNAR